MEPQQPSHSLIKRSSSIWRRFSRKEARPKRLAEEQRPNVRNRLQKRATESIPVQNKNNLIIAHMQAVEEPPKPTIPQLPTIRVVAADMQVSPFPNSPPDIHTVAWNVFLNPEQVYRVVMGFAPQQMEDKWCIYSEGPDKSGKLKVHFHRSWTGFKIAELFVLIDLKGEGAGKIVGIKWNGSDQTNGMDEEEAKYMISTTLAGVLGVELERQLP
ncbi:hypothetical protein CC78DRAFT_533833 [Lojkania enalia]|uniref:Uncharacterized protein n=1 Tax=Lojkania enalia TaxID=147567 RepID=A0A9P4K7K8_9PLEO|nr:hypothetical protein CC78DRAFT_533833 [Didymosphaeria enalia]